MENSSKLEKWKLNKSGFITKTTKQESYEAALSGIQMSRRAGNQRCVLLVLSPRHSTHLEWPFLYTYFRCLALLLAILFLSQRYAVYLTSDLTQTPGWQ